MQKKYQNGGHWTDALPENKQWKYILDPRKSSTPELKRLRAATDVFFDITGSPAVALNMAKNLIAKPLAKMGKGAVGWTNKTAGRWTEQLAQGPSEKSLRMYGTKEGKGALESAWNQELKTAKEMTQKVYGDLAQLPEEKQVREIISQMESIDLNSVVKALEKSKKRNPVGINKKVNRKIDELINDIQQTKELPGTQISLPGKKINPKSKTASEVAPQSQKVAGKKIKRKAVAPDEYRNIRIQLDDYLGAAHNKDYKEGLEKAISNAGNAMRKELVDNAPKEYKELMEVYGNKMNKLSRMKSKLGPDSEKAVERAFTMLRTSENASRQPVKELMGEFDEVFGTQFSQKSELMDMARKMGMPGRDKLEVPDFPKGVGSTKLAGILLGGAGMPRFSAKVLRVLDLIESGMGKTSSLGRKLSDVIAREDVAGATAIVKGIESLSEERKDMLEQAIEDDDNETIDRILGDK
jgi:hypothetical protein